MIYVKSYFVLYSQALLKCINVKIKTKSGSDSLWCLKPAHWVDYPVLIHWITLHNAYSVGYPTLSHRSMTIFGSLEP